MSIYSQETIVIVDIDNDTINDTIYIDSTNYDEVNNTAQIVCKLSSKQFKAIKSQNVYYDKEFPANSKIDSTANRFTYITNGMRVGEYYTFSFDETVKRIRLIEYYYYNLGNAVNDGQENTVINLLNGDIQSIWYHYDFQSEKLIEHNLNKKKKYKAIYLEDFSSDIDLLDNGD